MFELFKIKISLLAGKKNLQAKIPEMCFSLRSLVAFFYKNSQNSHCYMQSFFFFFFCIQKLQLESLLFKL